MPLFRMTKLLLPLVMLGAVLLLQRCPTHIYIGSQSLEVWQNFGTYQKIL